MITEPERAAVCSKAAIALHNSLRTTDLSLYRPPGFVDSEDGMGNSIPGSWRDEEQPAGLDSVSHTSSNRSLTTSQKRAGDKSLSSQRRHRQHDSSYNGYFSAASWGDGLGDIQEHTMLPWGLTCVW